MDREGQLPPLSVPGDVRDDVVSPSERRLLEGGAEPYDWLLVAGRLLRSHLTTGDRRAVRDALCQWRDTDAVVAARSRCDITVEEFGRAMAALVGESVEEGYPAERAGWLLVEARDDLESVAEAISFLRAAELHDDSFREVVTWAHRSLAERLRWIDGWAEEHLDTIGEQLRERPDDAARSRAVAVGSRVPGEYWRALVDGLQLADPGSGGEEILGIFDDALVRLRDRPPSIDPPLVRLPIHLLDLPGAATASDGNEAILLALADVADVEPIALLDEGRVTVKACASAPGDDGGGIAGLGIQHTESPDRLRAVEVWIGTVPATEALRVGRSGYWVSFAALKGASALELLVETDTGRHRCRVELEG